MDIINENIGEKEVRNELYYKIVNDYYTIFINNILNKNKKGKNSISIFNYDNININKKILDMIVNLKFKKN